MTVSSTDPAVLFGAGALVSLVGGLAAGWWLKTGAARRVLAARETEWSRRNGSYRAAAAVAEERSVELKEALDLSEARAAVHEETTRRLGAELEAERGRLQEARLQRDFFEVDLSRVKLNAVRALERAEELAPLAGQLPGLELEIKTLRAQALRSSTRAEEAVDARQKVEAEKTRLEIQVEALGNQLRQAAEVTRQEFERRSRQVEGWRAERAGAQAERVALEAREREIGLALEQARAEIEGNRARLRQLELGHQAKVAELEAANGALRAQVSRLDPLRRQLEDREELIRTLATERDAAHADLVRREREWGAEVIRLESRLADLEGQKRAAEAREVKLRETEAKLARIGRERDQLATTLQRSLAELETLKSEVRDRDQRFRTLAGEYRGTVSNKEQEISGLKAHVEGLEAQLQERVLVAARTGTSPEPALNEADRSRDDLKLIRGIGPALERVLNEEGIYLYRQIATWTSDDIARISERLRAFPDRIHRDDWIGSARAAHQRKYGEEP